MKRRERRDRVWVPLGIVLVAVVALIWLVPLLMHAPAEGQCPQTTAPGARQRAPKGRPPSLALKPGQSSTLALGRSLGHKGRQLDFELQGGKNVLSQGSLLAVDFDPFVRSDDTDLNRANYSARAEFLDGRVRLRICLARTGRTSPSDGGPRVSTADAGTYEGTVSIVDPRVARTDVPFTFTVAYPYWPRVLAIVVVTEIAALCWTWVLRREDSANPKAVFSHEFWSWLGSGVGIASAGVAAVAGVGAVIAIYVNSDTWALDVAGLVALVTGVFGAFVTAATIQPVASKSRDGTPTPAAEGE